MRGAEIVKHGENNVFYEHSSTSLKSRLYKMPPLTNIKNLILYNIIYYTIQ